VTDQDVRRLRTQLKLLQRRLRREPVPARAVSRTAMQALAALSRLPAGAGPRQLGEELQMTSSNIAATLRELEAAGCITRRRDDADARRVLVHSTKRGSALVAAIRSERDTWLGGAIEALLDAEETRTLLAAGDLIQRLAEYEQ
jgi:DNA-binding MarR family transcriptional regulator